MGNSDRAMVPRAPGRRRSPAIIAAAAGARDRGAAPGHGGRRRATGDGDASVDARGAFTLDLSARGDFVAQTTFVQCVGASMQMMLNMIRAKDDRTIADPALPPGPRPHR